MSCFCTNKNENGEDKGYLAVNYESDFTLNITLPPEMVDCDFRLTFYTNDNQPYSASRTNGVLTDNIHDLGENKFLVVFRNHGLQCGRLRVKAYYWGINELSPDGKMREVVPELADIILVASKGDSGTPPDLQLTQSFFMQSLFEEAVRNGYSGTKEEYYAFINGFPTVTKKGRMTLGFSDNTIYQFDVADISDLPYYYNEGEGIGNFDDLYYADATIVGEFDETESEAEEGESV